MTPENILKGALCGFVAGVAATIAKTVWEDYFPVRDEDTASPPAKMAQQLTERTLSDKEIDQASLGIHIAFGVGTGVLYGASGELVPEITSGLGMPFGMGFYALTHGSVVPALDLEPWPTEVEPTYAINEFAGHFVYALTLEAIRLGMRKYVVQ